MVVAFLFFLTVLISLEEKLYIKIYIGKYPNSKRKIYGFFFYNKIVYRLTNHILNV